MNEALKKKDNKEAGAKTQDKAEVEVKQEKKKFVRVAIEEDSDEEEEEGEGQAKKEASGDGDEPLIQEVGGSEKSDSNWWKKGKGIESPFPLTSAKEIEEHSRKSKRLMQSGGDEFLKKYEAF